MSGFQLVSKVVGSLAWPLAAILIVVILRKGISSILSALSKRVAHLNKLSAYGVKVEFESDIAETRVVTEAALSAVSGSANASEAITGSKIATLTRISALSDISPRSAILEAAFILETSVIGAAKRRGREFDPKRGAAFMKAMDYLRNTTPPNLYESIENVRRLRNEATHLPDFEISKKAVQNYALSALKLADYFDHINEETNEEPNETQ